VPIRSMPFPTRRSSDLRAPDNVACRQYGDWLKVDWSYLYEPGDTLAGFKVKWGDGGVPVTWDVPPAVDTGLQGGDGGNPREYFRSEEHTSELQSRENLV